MAVATFAAGRRSKCPKSRRADLAKAGTGFALLNGMDAFRRFSFFAVLSALLGLTGACAPATGDGPGSSEVAGKADGPGGFTCDEAGKTNLIPRILTAEQTPYDDAVPLRGRVRMASTEQGLVMATWSQGDAFEEPEPSETLDVSTREVDQARRAPAVGYQLFDAQTLEPKGEHRFAVDGITETGSMPELSVVGDRVVLGFTRQSVSSASLAGDNCVVKALEPARLGDEENEQRARNPYAGLPALHAGSCGPLALGWDGENIGALHVNRREKLAYDTLDLSNAVRPSMSGGELTLGEFDRIGGTALAWSSAPGRFIGLVAIDRGDGNTDIASRNFTSAGHALTDKVWVSSGDGRSRWPQLAASTEGHFGAIWSEMGDEPALYFRALDDEGHPASSPVRVASDVAPGSADFVWDPDSELFGISWTGIEGGVYFAQYRADGRRQGSVQTLAPEAEQRAITDIVISGKTFQVAFSNSPRSEVQMGLVCRGATGSVGAAPSSDDSSSDDSSSDDSSSEDEDDDFIAAT
jgi:hypothetical protein